MDKTLFFSVKESFICLLALLKPNNNYRHNEV